MDLQALFGIVIATCVAVILRWAANRFPGPTERKRRERAERIEELEDQMRIANLEKQLREGTLLPPEDKVE